MAKECLEALLDYGAETDEGQDEIEASNQYDVDNLMSAKSDEGQDEMEASDQYDVDNLMSDPDYIPTPKAHKKRKKDPPVRDLCCTCTYKSTCQTIDCECQYANEM